LFFCFFVIYSLNLHIVGLFCNIKITFSLLQLQSKYGTRYCQWIHNTLLRARHAAAVQYSIHELPIADLYRWSWGKHTATADQSIWSLRSKLIGYWYSRNQSAVP